MYNYWVFLGRLVHTSSPWRHHHGWSQAGTFSKFVPPNALKIHFLALSVLKFLCKTFPKLLKFTLWNTLPLGWLLKNSYIHKQNLYRYKLARAAKQSEMKKCCKSTEGITQSSVNYLSKFYFTINKKNYKIVTPKC